MSLPTGEIPSIPPETIRVAQAAFPKGNKYMTLREHLGAIFVNADFADLYPRVGQHGVAPWRLALVTIMQFAEDLSDRDAADAVRGRIDWKYVLGLELDDPGFDFSVLSEFRTRLVKGEAERRLLEKVLSVCEAHGILKTDGVQRTDATHILGAVRLLNRIEMVHETLRHTLNTLAHLIPDWLKAQVKPDWFDLYSKRLTEYHLPQDPTERKAVALAIGADGLYLLTCIYADDTLDWVRYVPAVDTLRRVWTQTYYHSDGQLYWREKKEEPSGSKKVMSPHDQQVRVSKKRDVTWVGYKVHLTETCDTDSPNLITQVETTVSTLYDAPALTIIQEDLQAHHRLPAVHLVDGGIYRQMPS